MKYDAVSLQKKFLKLDEFRNFENFDFFQPLKQLGKSTLVVQLMPKSYS